MATQSKEERINVCKLLESALPVLSTF